MPVPFPNGLSFLSDQPRVSVVQMLTTIDCSWSRDGRTTCNKCKCIRLPQKMENLPCVGILRNRNEHAVKAILFLSMLQNAQNKRCEETDQDAETCWKRRITLRK